MRIHDDKCSTKDQSRTGCSLVVDFLLSSLDGRLLTVARLTHVVGHAVNLIKNVLVGRDVRDQALKYLSVWWW